MSFYKGASLVAQRLKCLPAMQETLVQSLSWEDPLEKEMATHSSILAWRIPWTEESGGLPSTGWQRVGHDFTFTFTFLVLESVTQTWRGKRKPAGRVNQCFWRATKLNILAVESLRSQLNAREWGPWRVPPCCVHSACS